MGKLKVNFVAVLFFLLMVSMTYGLYSLDTCDMRYDDRDGYAKSITDKNGNIIITGESSAEDFVTTKGHYGTEGTNKVFISKFTVEGKFVFSVTIGGKSSQTPTHIAIDADDNIIVGGFTNSKDFPTTYDTAIHFVDDPFKVDRSPEITYFHWIFLTKFSNSGDIMWSRVISGIAGEEMNDLKIINEKIILLGTSHSPSLPDYPNVNTTSYDLETNSIVTNSGYNDNDIGLFVMSLDLGGNIEQMSVFQGDKYSMGDAIAIDDIGNVQISFTTYSNHFPGLIETLEYNQLDITYYGLILHLDHNFQLQFTTKIGERKSIEHISWNQFTNSFISIKNVRTDSEIYDSILSTNLLGDKLWETKLDTTALSIAQFSNDSIYLSSFSQESYQSMSDHLEIFNNQGYKVGRLHTQNRQELTNPYIFEYKIINSSHFFLLGTTDSISIKTSYNYQNELLGISDVYISLIKEDGEYLWDTYYGFEGNLKEYCDIHDSILYLLLPLLTLISLVPVIKSIRFTSNEKLWDGY